MTRDTRHVYSRALGYADRARGRLNNLETLFNLARSTNRSHSLIGARRETRIVENNGGAPGINAAFQMYPDLGYTVVVLANYDPPAAGIVANRIERLIVG